MTPDAAAPEGSGGAPGVALVTGGTSGIGRGIVELLATSGWTVATNHIGQAGLAQELVDSAADLPGRVQAYEADVTRSAPMAEMVRAVEADLGPIEAVVTNAGVVSHHRLWEMPDEEFDRIVQTNLKGTFLCLKQVLPAMVARRRGSVITIASELAFDGAPGLTAYCASKGGVISLSKSLAREVAEYGIRVHVIAPGPTLTPMLMAREASHSPEVLATIPLGRFGDVHDVARTVEFLLGPGGDFYTGWVFSPNGGSVM
jgi:3-oxoacyl-[acyl-carrier protein] reductase